MYLEKANSLLQVDRYFLSKQGITEYANFFCVNEANEQNLSPSKLANYFSLKKDLAIKRQNFQNESSSEELAKSYVIAYDAYTAFKLSNDFTYGSAFDFYSKIVVPKYNEKKMTIVTVHEF